MVKTMKWTFFGQMAAEQELRPPHLWAGAVRLVMVVIMMWCYLASPGMADNPPESVRFISEPNAVWSYPPAKVQVFEIEKLPPAIQESVQESMAMVNRREARAQGFVHDLNGDKQPEYFVENYMGGSGGPAYDIWSERNGNWEIIGGFQGGFHLLKSKDGWMPIVYYTRGGAGDYFKAWLEYKDGKYRRIKAARIRSGVVSVVPPEEWKTNNTPPDNK